MIFVDNEDVTDPRINLAIEEHLLRNLETDEDLLLFYINEPAIIIGRYQNTLEEINAEYVAEHGIHVVRRLSGGGAVYHDLGNLNFSFITQRAPENFHNFKKFTGPVISVLRELGIPAELNGRNDIVVDGRKVSGNAQYIAARRMVSHGTLLFDSDLERVSQALNPKPNKISSKGIKSVRSRVANLAEYLSEPLEIAEFRLRLLRGIFQGEAGIRQVHLTSADWESILALTQERYATWEWNYGHSPACNVHRTQRFAIGEIEARIEVQNGRIEAIKFYGDFLGYESLAGLEARLHGVRYDRESVGEVIKAVDGAQYFPGLTQEELLSLIV